MNRVHLVLELIKGILLIFLGVYIIVTAWQMKHRH
jgi:ABC-type nickel/cobalt efflux system permease component RcnA